VIRMVTAELGGWVIEADPEVNRARYLVASTWDCDCDHCVNWRALGEPALPPGIVEFLGSLGIDVRKPAEVFEYGPLADGRHLMGGWYQFSGRILHSQPRKQSRAVTEAIPTRLEDGFRLGFFDHLAGPRPAVELPEPHATFEFGCPVRWLGIEPPSCRNDEPIDP
jgi:hypothetical protein